MKTFLVFLCVFAVTGIAVTRCEDRFKRQMWPAPSPDFFPGFGFQQNIPKPSKSFDGADGFWVGPPRFDQRPGSQNGFGRDDFLNGDRNNNNSGNRRTTTENLGPITSTPRTIHTAPQNCNCLMTQQFNPVCGTDGNTYRNKGLLNCYQRCGRRVFQKRLGTC